MAAVIHQIGTNPEVSLTRLTANEDLTDQKMCKKKKKKKVEEHRGGNNVNLDRLYKNLSLTIKKDEMVTGIKLKNIPQTHNMLTWGKKQWGLFSFFDFQ